MTKTEHDQDPYQRPQDYEALFDPGLDDLPFYLEQARSAPGPVLDLGCGTGRLLWPLRRAGIAVEGLDSSPSMLERCREHGAELGLSAPLHRADWRTFDLGQRYGAVLFPFNGLQHLLTAQDLDAFFERLQAHLVPGGIFAFDVHLPQPLILARDPDEHFGVEAGPYTSGRMQVVAEQSRYDKLSQVLEQTWTLEDSENVASKIKLKLRQFFPQELLLLLSIKRFRVLKVLGTFKGETLKNEHLKQILICKYFV